MSVQSQSCLDPDAESVKHIDRDGLDRAEESFPSVGQISNQAEEPKTPSDTSPNSTASSGGSAKNSRRPNERRRRKVPQIYSEHEGPATSDLDNVTCERNTLQPPPGRQHLDETTASSDDVTKSKAYQQLHAKFQVLETEKIDAYELVSRHQEEVSRLTEVSRQCAEVKREAELNQRKAELDLARSSEKLRQLEKKNMALEEKKSAAQAEIVHLRILLDQASTGRQEQQRRLESKDGECEELTYLVKELVDKHAAETENSETRLEGQAQQLSELGDQLRQVEDELSQSRHELVQAREQQFFLSDEIDILSKHLRSSRAKLNLMNELGGGLSQLPSLSGSRQSTMDLWKRWDSIGGSGGRRTGPIQGIGRRVSGRSNLPSGPFKPRRRAFSLLRNIQSYAPSSTHSDNVVPDRNWDSNIDPAVDLPILMKRHTTPMPRRASVPNDTVPGRLRIFNDSAIEEQGQSNSDESSKPNSLPSIFSNERLDAGNAPEEVAAAEQKSKPPNGALDEIAANSSSADRKSGRGLIEALRKSLQMSLDWTFRADPRERDVESISSGGPPPEAERQLHVDQAMSQLEGRCSSESRIADGAVQVHDDVDLDVLCRTIDEYGAIWEHRSASSTRLSAASAIPSPLFGKRAKNLASDSILGRAAHGDTQDKGMILPNSGIQNTEIMVNPRRRHNPTVLAPAPPRRLRKISNQDVDDEGSGEGIRTTVGQRGADIQSSKKTMDGRHEMHINPSGQASRPEEKHISEQSSQEAEVPHLQNPTTVKQKRWIPVNIPEYFAIYRCSSSDLCLHSSWITVQTRRFKMSREVRWWLVLHLLWALFVVALAAYQWHEASKWYWVNDRTYEDVRSWSNDWVGNVWLEKVGWKLHMALGTQDWMIR